MKKLIFPVFIFGFSLVLNAQKTPLKVYGLPVDTLKSLVQKHPKYFEHLKNVWLKKPSKIKEDELMLLYYGSVFMKNYDPVKEDIAVEQIAKLIGQMDFQNAILEGKKLLQIYPLNSRLHLLLGYAYKRTGERQKSKFYYKKYGDLLRIPLYSGTGKDFENAFIVRIISDEYLILNQKNLELVRQELRYHNRMPYDVLLIKSVSKDNKRMNVLPKEKLYFNIYFPYFIGKHINYKMVQEEAIRKYKVHKKSGKKKEQ